MNTSIKTTATHKSTGNIHNVEIYSTFVWFTDQMREVTRLDFDELFTVNN